MALSADAEEFRSVSLEGSQPSSHMTSQRLSQVSSSQGSSSAVLPEASCQALPAVYQVSQIPSQVWALSGESGEPEEAQPQLQVELDELGEYIEVSSGQLAGRLYLEKFELSKKRNVAECVLVEDKWLTLGEFETKSGKKTKNWRKSVKHGGVPLNDLITETFPCKLPITRLNIQANSHGISPSQSSARHPWFPELTTSFNELEQRLKASIEDAIQKAMGSMHRQIKEEVSTLTLQVNELQRRVDKLEAQRMGDQSTEQQSVRHEDLDPKIGMLETQVKHLSSAFSAHNRKVEAEEWEARKNSVIIVGLEESENENAVEAVKRLFAMKLDLQEPKFDTANRIGRKQSDKCRPIKVKFSSLQEKKLVMERKQSLKHTRIYINHDLTKLQQERSKKLREAKKVAIQRYQNQVVRIVKGKLCVDGQPLSSETFLTLCDNI